MKRINEFNWNNLNTLKFDESTSDYFVLCAIKSVVNQMICILNALKGNVIAICTQIVNELFESGAISFKTEYDEITKTLKIFMGK